MAINEAPERFLRVLGQGIMKVWATLPQEIQKEIFESAVVAGHKSEQDEALREQLALFLHDHHPATVDGETSAHG